MDDFNMLLRIRTTLPAEKLEERRNSCDNVFNVIIIYLLRNKLFLKTLRNSNQVISIAD